MQLGLFVTLVGTVGAGLLAWLVSTAEWDQPVVIEVALFATLVTAAGFFPLTVGPRIKAGVTTAPIFGAVLLLPIAQAALAAGLGTLAYQVLLRARGDGDLRLPLYKYPFNTSEAILTASAGSAAFSALGGDVLWFTHVGTTAIAMYLVNSGLVSLVVGIQIRHNPVRILWQGSRENGLVEVSLFAFGYLGAVAYAQAVWTLLVLFMPVGIIYFAFSSLAGSNLRLEEALARLKELQGKLLSTAKLASIGAFSLDLAHQLRNPLFVVTGRLQSIQADVPQEGAVGRHLDAALTAGMRMQELLQNFVSAGGQRWARVELTGLMEDAIEIALLRSTKAVQIERRYGEDLPIMEGNPVLLREAFSNLLSNAVDASTQGGMVTIDLAQENDGLWVTIADMGHGISTTQMATLFEPFQSHKPGGSGLGLFSAKHIVEMHRGTIGISSSEGEGTRVDVYLPSNPGEEHTDTPDS